MFVNKWDNLSFTLSWLMVAKDKSDLVCKYPWQKWQDRGNNETYKEAKQVILSFHGDQKSPAKVFKCWHQRRDVVVKSKNRLSGQFASGSYSYITLPSTPFWEPAKLAKQPGLLTMLWGASVSWCLKAQHKNAEYIYTERERCMLHFVV